MAEGMLTKPAPTTKETVKPTQTFTFVKGKEEGDAKLEYLYGQTGEEQQLTTDQLRDYFEGGQGKTNRLQEQFGSFDNYLNYMTEREQLIQSGDYDVGNWSEADTGFTEDQQMILEGDADLTIDASDPSQDVTKLRQSELSTQQGGYNNWLNSEANQALLEKYGVSGTAYSETGDKFQWNGSGYVKVADEDKVSMGDYAKIAMGAAVGSMLGPALGNLATGTATAGTATTAGTFAQGAINSSLGTAISQGISTGSVDISSLGTAAITGGIGGIADAIKAGELAGTAAENAITQIATSTGLSVDRTTDLVAGLLNGTVTGDDLTDTALGVVQGYTEGELKNFIKDSFGNELDIPNLFDEGTTTIPIESLNPFLETAVDAAFEGELSGADVIKALYDYGTEEGSFAFLDPGLEVDSDLFGDTPQFIKEIEDAARTGATYVRDFGRDVREGMPEFSTPQPIKEIEDTLRSGATFVRDVGRDIREAIPSGTTPEGLSLGGGFDTNLDFGSDMSFSGGKPYEINKADLGYTPLKIPELIKPTDYNSALNGLFGRLT